MRLCRRGSSPSSWPERARKERDERTFGGMARALAAAGFLAAACQGREPLSQSGAAGAGGQTDPATGGSGGADRDAGSGRPGATATAPDAGDGGTTACKPLGAIPRRLWRLSAEQWGNAVQSLLSLPAPPVLTSRGGESFAAR